MSSKSKRKPNSTRRRCCRCGELLQEPGEQWICVIEQADVDGFGVVTQLICPQCQTPLETAESSVNDILCQYIWRDGRVALKPKPELPQGV